ncbi:perforin-1-like [Tachyglossus aculeatus]|uniref:perforin-1-like n=1 Tax=Tachyglossus aculeatus TaxID=9261 RepID=UPI0018F2C66E|nr:perforin-1-like [Tachyglossus aculeatus]
MDPFKDCRPAASLKDGHFHHASQRWQHRSSSQKWLKKEGIHYRAMGTCFLLLFLLLHWSPPIPALCIKVTKEKCEKHQSFVPGSAMVGEGVDITRLQRTGHFPIDPSQYLHKNGTCTLCTNTLLEGERQRLPIAIMSWHSQVSECNKKVVKATSHSAIGVADMAAQSIKNDWKLDLDLQPKPGTQIHLALAGSHSKAANFAERKSQEDQYFFSMNMLECRYYKLRLVNTPPLKEDFKQAVHSLPFHFTNSTDSEYFQLIYNYGTHFMTALELGGRTSDITALRSCKLALENLSEEDVVDCLNAEASANMENTGNTSTKAHKCEKQKKSHGMNRSFYEMYNEHHVEVIGGHLTKIVDLLLDINKVDQFSSWMASLPKFPGLVSYSLSPLHMLLRQQDPRREGLKQAVREYLKMRAWKQNPPCPPGKMKSSQDPCRCVCSNTDSTNEDGCPREKGLVKLEVKFLKAHDLWGDDLTQTDGYVKIFFRGRERRSNIILNDNNPVWWDRMNFGIVQISTVESMQVQLLDYDNGWDDDLLRSCNGELEAGSLRIEVCNFHHGSLTFMYQVTCLPHLTGRKCLNYAPETFQGEGIMSRMKQLRSQLREDIFAQEESYIQGIGENMENKNRKAPLPISNETYYENYSQETKLMISNGKGKLISNYDTHFINILVLGS